MTNPTNRHARPWAGFVVLRRLSEGKWEVLGEVERTNGLTARAARARAIQMATRGTARAGEVYAAILRSEWKVSQEWESAPGRPIQSPGRTPTAKSRNNRGEGPDSPGRRLTAAFGDRSGGSLTSDLRTNDGPGGSHHATKRSNDLTKDESGRP
jgi:hypothetical protein